MAMSNTVLSQPVLSITTLHENNNDDDVMSKLYSITVQYEHTVMEYNFKCLPFVGWDGVSFTLIFG